ncbi:MAG: hydrogenase 3 maturation endopeptidase HyCI [Sedimentisphaerales bacterium]|nr:hydrogenase 3 maturation endopeptidase HyCI [Sedimentisphaerales bacterium]
MGSGEQLFEQLNKLHGSKTVIVGIGNTLKADDGVGPLVCQQLRNAKSCAELIDAGTVPENYIQRIIKKTPQNLLIIDAIDFHASPGTIDIFKPEQLNSIVVSTHTLSPRLFAEMVSQNIEADVYFVGIQPAQTRLGDSMSPQVYQAAQQLTQMLIDVFPPMSSAQ